MVFPRLLLPFFMAALWAPVTLYAQDTVNQVDAQGKRTGYWIKTDQAGAKVYEGRFMDGIPYGEFRYYYPDGTLKTISVFSDDGQKARSISYYRNGKLMAKGNYLNERKDSTWLFYSEEDSTILSEENYRAGVRDGISKVFLPGHILSEQTTWKNGVQDGPWELYFTDGHLKLKGSYKNGDRDGRFILYYPSGAVMITGSYREGHQDGRWVYLTEKGDTDKTETYEKGVLIDKEPKDE
jgi:antitoxin component YwqK of YwqJK toxin-antitoxin module